MEDREIKPKSHLQSRFNSVSRFIFIPYLIGWKIEDLFGEGALNVFSLGLKIGFRYNFCSKSISLKGEES